MNVKSAKTNWLLFSSAIALAAVAGWLGRSLLTRNTTAPPAPAPQETQAATGNLDANSQLDALARYAMPTKQHALLDGMSGRWITRTRYWMKPGLEPAEAQGTSERRWILDGRFLLEELEGGDLALPFRALGLYGFDAFEQKYTSAWVDTMSTAIMTNLGTYDETKHVVNFTGYYSDPWTGRKKKNRGLTRFVSNDQHVLELHVSEPDGTEYKMIEITYTRQGGTDHRAPRPAERPEQP